MKNRQKDKSSQDQLDDRACPALFNILRQLLSKREGCADSKGKQTMADRVV